MIGKEICRLMRVNEVTIRGLSARMGITQKRIREVREHGLTDPYAIRDWVQGITGADPGHAASQRLAKRYDRREWDASITRMRHRVHIMRAHARHIGGFQGSIES